MRFVGFLISSLIGFVIGNYLLTGAAAAYASTIISYHLYLVFLIFLFQKNDEKEAAPNEKGLAMPIGQTILTHSAFLALVIGLPYLRHQLPFFSIIRLFIPAMAPFEVKWLFSKEKKMKTFGESQETKPAEITMKKGETLSIDDLINAATAEEHEFFLAYMRQKNRTFAKPGRTVREEYGYWLADRARKRAALAAAAAAGTAANPGASNATSPSS